MTAWGRGCKAGTPHSLTADGRLLANVPSHPLSGQEAISLSSVVRWSPDAAAARTGCLESSTSATFPERKKRGKVAKYSWMSLGGKELREIVLCQRPFLGWQSTRGDSRSRALVPRQRTRPGARPSWPLVLRAGCPRSWPSPQRTPLLPMGATDWSKHAFLSGNSTHRANCRSWRKGVYG